MILVRAPLRMSFVGGGSDMKEFYSTNTGRVLSTAIDKYVYVAVKRKFGGGIRVSYSKTEICETARQVQHPIVRECLLECGITTGIEIVSLADIPSSGSGLGSSSAFTVALLKALFVFTNQDKSDVDVAQLACEIEIVRCGEPIGKQDQFASAVGGLNVIEFHSNDSVKVIPCQAENEIKQTLNEHILVLYTGATRSARAVLEEQKKGFQTLGEKTDAVSFMTSLVEPCRVAIQNGDVKQFGRILDENWRYKRTLASSITSDWLDSAYNSALSEGAYGGKILGAGAGGFFLFVADPHIHERISEKLKMDMLTVNFPVSGVSVVYNQKSELL